MPGQFFTKDTEDGGVASTTSNNKSGIFARNDSKDRVLKGQGGNGVFGLSTVPNASGVFGANNNGGTGVAGHSAKGNGVYGHSDSNAGVVGESTSFDGGSFVSHSDRHAGVSGHNRPHLGHTRIDQTPLPPNGNGYGVWGDADSGTGVAGFSKTWRGVYGHSDSNAGVVGESDGFDGVWGISHSQKNAGVSGHNDNGGLAGFFEGDVEVTGDVRLRNGDCAEDFHVAGTEAKSIEPGTVMVLADEETLRQSQQAYDKRVAGVISGAGNYKPGIVLDKQRSESDRKPIALLGKVFCKVDASFAQIEVGDLLTTSPTPGYAMKATDPAKAFGAVIGKALRPLSKGQGLIPILIALQ